MNTIVSAHLEVLKATPETVIALLGDLSNLWTHNRADEGVWTAYEIVAHFIHGEHEDWIPRTRIILEHGANRTFDPFDPQAFSEYSRNKDLDQLLTEFKELRVNNCRVLKGLKLSETDLERKGKHPAFGEVTLDQLLHTWVAHDLGHIAQISRVLARRYKSNVGPWRQYLAVVS